MPLRDILVHVDSSAACKTRLELAVKLAHRHDAHLTGIHVMTHAYYGPGLEVVTREAEAAGALFHQTVRAATIAFEWRCIDCAVVGTGIAEVLVRHAYAADLLIIGQPAPDSQLRPQTSLAERLILAAGRPVLIVPYAGRFSTLGERILVAWSAGREACRAVNDALPLLQQAQRTLLLEVASDPGRDVRKKRAALDFCGHLARHGVVADAEQVPCTPVALADQLLNRACEDGYDLLVMGAFATTASGLRVLGPVARHILQQMTLPVLMAH